MLDIRLTRSRARAVALVDVGEQGASVGICREEDGMYLLAASGSSALSLEERDAAHTGTLLPSQMRDAAEKARRAYSGPPIEAAYVVMHAPWIASRTISAETDFGSRARVYDATIAALARESLSRERFERERLMEASVVRVELNGFLTAAPAGKSASRMRVVSLLSECDPVVRQGIEAEAHKLFPGADVLWRSGLRACAAFARRQSLGDEYFILDMGATTSQLASVRSGQIESRMLPLGAASILSSVDSKKQPEEMLGALRMLESEAASGGSADTLRTQMARAESDVVKALADGIGQIAAERRVSNTLLLLAHKDLEPWLTRLLSRIDFSQFTITTLPFDVRTPAGFSATGTLAVDLALVNSELSEIA
jgi:hypothetical protein